MKLVEIRSINKAQSINLTRFLPRTRYCIVISVKSFLILNPPHYIANQALLEAFQGYDTILVIKSNLMQGFL